MTDHGQNQKGVSLIITFFVMIIVLAVALSVSVLLYSEIKLVRNMSDSVISYYAGESGVEKVLFYDKQVLPPGEDENKRGLCYMFDLANTKRCREDSSFDASLWCKGPPALTEGCSPTLCSSCSITFSTDFDNRSYSTAAAVSSTGAFSIDSWGSFGPLLNRASRKVQIIILPTE